MSDTATSITTLLAGDAVKALEALPVITSTINAASASLTADQHADLVTKTTDLIAAVTPSVGVAASAGLIGQGDAAHIKQAVTDVAAAASTATVWANLVNFFRSLF